MNPPYSESALQELALGKRSLFWRGAKSTIPLIIGAIPFGILFGTLAGPSGLSIWATMAMSFFVFAGAAQFIAVGLLAAGASPILVIMTTFVVNLRHLLYAAAFLEEVKKLPQGIRALMAFALTDETFAATSDFRRQKPSPEQFQWFYLGSMIAMFSCWQLSTWVGITLGQTFPDMTNWGLEFAMVVTFTGMVTPYLRSKPMWLCVIAATLLAAATWTLPHKLGLVYSASTAILLGYSALLLERRKQKPQPQESSNE